MLTADDSTAAVERVSPTPVIIRRCEVVICLKRTFPILDVWTCEAVFRCVDAAPNCDNPHSPTGGRRNSYRPNNIGVARHYVWVGLDPLLPSPSLPFPLPLTSPLPSPPLKSRPPLLRLGGLGERFSSPSGSGQSPAAKRYLVNFRLKISPLVATIFRCFSGNETSKYDRHKRIWPTTASGSQEAQTLYSQTTVQTCNDKWTVGHRVVQKSKPQLCSCFRLTIVRQASRHTWWQWIKEYKQKSGFHR